MTLNRSAVRGLHGRVRVVTVGATYRVRITTVAADLRVHVVSVAPIWPGQWQFVQVGEDFTVEFVSVGEDFTISMG